MQMTWWKTAILIVLWWGASELAARADSPPRPAAVTLDLAGLKPLSADAVSQCGMAKGGKNNARGRNHGQILQFRNPMAAHFDHDKMTREAGGNFGWV